MKHIWKECEGCDSCKNGVDCVYDGIKCVYDPIIICEVCGARESELPKECPGFRLPNIVKDLIAEGGLNYYDGKWDFNWHKCASD